MKFNYRRVLYTLLLMSCFSQNTLPSQRSRHVDRTARPHRRVVSGRQARGARSEQRLIIRRFVEAYQRRDYRRVRRLFDSIIAHDPSSLLSLSRDGPNFSLAAISFRVNLRRVASIPGLQGSGGALGRMPSFAYRPPGRGRQYLLDSELVKAVCQGNEERAENFLDLGANPRIMVNIPDLGAIPLIHLAFILGYAEIGELLISYL